jgi:hypothetical protein
LDGDRIAREQVEVERAHRAAEEAQAALFPSSNPR